MIFSIYTSETCGYCHKAIHLLEERDLAYEVIDAKSNIDELQEKVSAAGFPPARTVPQIFLNDTYIGGHDDLVNWLRSKSL